MMNNDKIQVDKQQKDLEKKRITLSGNFADILLHDLEKKLGSLDCFRFLSPEHITDLILRNYNNINAETLEYTVCKLLIDYMDDEFKYGKNKKHQIDFSRLLSENSSDF